MTGFMVEMVPELRWRPQELGLGFATSAAELQAYYFGLTLRGFVFSRVQSVECRAGVSVVRV